MCVVIIVLAASPPAPSDDPALKENQPNQSSPAPVAAIGRLCGASAALAEPKS